MPLDICVPLAARVTLVGVREQPASAGAPAHVRLTAPVKLFAEVTLRVKPTEPPAGVASEVGVALSVKSGVVEVPVPVRATVCGLLGSLSVMTREADSAPIVEGEKVTLMVQVPPAATEVPQVLVCETSPAFDPTIGTSFFIRLYPSP